MPKRLTSAGRVVIKIGSALLVNQDSGRLRRKWLNALAGDLATMVGRGQEIVLVSSGAIALGARHIGLSIKRQNLRQSQAAAAVGQADRSEAFFLELGEDEAVDVGLRPASGPRRRHRRGVACTAW